MTLGAPFLLWGYIGTCSNDLGSSMFAVGVYLMGPIFAMGVSQYML